MGHRHPKEHPNPIMDVIVPDLEAAALDHEDHDLVAVVIEMIVTAAVIVVAAAVVVVDRDREAVIVAAGGDRGVDLVLMTGGGVVVLGRGRIAAVEVMIVATEV